MTCILLNNGVFGETGGHMTATSVIGQRTKNSLEGRDAEYHGYPILIGDLIAQLQGASYVARGSVHNAGSVARTRKMFKPRSSHNSGRGLHLRRGPHDVPDRLVHPDGRRPDYMQRRSAKCTSWASSRSTAASVRPRSCTPRTSPSSTSSTNSSPAGGIEK